MISDIVCYIFWFHIAWVLFCDIRWCTCMWYLWFQAVLFVWEQIQDSDHRMYHAHRSFAGVALVVLRILLAALFAWNLNVIVSSERSALRREFYKSFTKSCMLWFLCYPLLVVMSWIFYEYLRYKLITMGVVLCQCCAVAMLYKLFFSRSLYWEVSALSSTLPLRMDRTLGHKLYSWPLRSHICQTLGHTLYSWFQVFYYYLMVNENFTSLFL